MDFPVSQPDVGLVGGVFVDENAVTGQPGSRIPATWGNAVTKELLNVLQEAGIEPDESDTGQVAAAILKMISEAGGMPRFTPYVWGGRGDAMPEGDTQSSGQQLLDLMYPTMRADVLATQFYCSEAQWQADPYKRVTHWSLGDGASWMRPPDKNGVQPGNVGSFYGAGSNPAGDKTGTAVIDAMRNIRGQAPYLMAVNDAAPAAGAFKWELKRNFAAQQINAPGYDQLNFDASRALPAGTTTDPITGEFRPRTWYGVWMIRMYGRVLNTGALDAAGLNARLDMMDARVATLEGRQKSLGDGQSWLDVTASRSFGTTYTNNTGRTICVAVSAQITTASFLWIYGAVNGVQLAMNNGQVAALVGLGVTFLVPAGATYSVTATSGAVVRAWNELRGL